MKGYITNNKCYIFPQEAAQIPEVEAEVYFVQQEDYVAWVEANESLVDKISPYNYKVMTVNPKVWSGHTDDDLEPVVPTTFNINVIGVGTGVDSITSDGEGIEYGTTVTVVCKTDYEVRNVETVNTHESVSYTLTDTLTWQFTMPQDDIYLEVQPVQTPDPNEQ